MKLFWVHVECMNSYEFLEEGNTDMKFNAMETFFFIASQSLCIPPFFLIKLHPHSTYRKLSC